MARSTMSAIFCLIHVVKYYIQDVMLLSTPISVKLLIHQNNILAPSYSWLSIVSGLVLISTQQATAQHFFVHPDQHLNFALKTMLFYFQKSFFDKKHSRSPQANIHGRNSLSHPRYIYFSDNPFSKFGTENCHPSKGG